jgi:hypothetical protein
MTQPPYRPTEGHPMRRFALFAAALVILVAIGSQPRSGGGARTSMCVCIPSRAAFILRSAIARTQAPSARRFTVRASVAQ